MKRIFVVAAIALATACGGGGKSSTAPTDTTLSAPSTFTITLQQVFMTSNTVAFSWSSTGATTYKLMIGSAAGASDALNVDVTGTTYTWTAPRTANIYYARVAPTSGGQTGSAATEIPLFTIDMRQVIDALYFGSGPMAADTVAANVVAIWPDGATINVVVTEESGAVSLTAAQTFVADYLAAMSNHITVNISTTPVKWTGVDTNTVPLNTVVVRVDNSICPQVGVIACAYYGPLPYGLGRSTVNLNAAPTSVTVGGSIAIAHEIGHAFGLHHLRVNSSVRPELRFLMNPTLLVSQLSDVEKNALAAARAGGMRNSWTRAQAVSAGLVLANPNGASVVPSAAVPELRDIIEPRIIR